MNWYKILGGVFMVYKKFLFLLTLSIQKTSFTNDTQSIFEQIFNSNEWHSKESVSGTGSELSQTETIRREIPDLLKKLKITSLLDAPCGDYNWLQKMDTSFLNSYIGIDIVEKLIENNSRNYTTNKTTFYVRDIINEDLPYADLILCRDCLVHLTYEQIFSTVKNFKKSKAKFLLTTTFPFRKTNSNIKTGQWRPLNLEKPPFNFSKPIFLITENCTEAENTYADKSLGLWLIEDLPDFN